VNRKYRRRAANAFLALSVAGTVTVLAACHGGGGNTGGTEQKAKTAASAADAQLAEDGYRPLHAPGFGKADVGLKITGNGYELVYTAKDAELVRTAVDEADKRPQQGVSFRAAGNLAVIDATSLSQLKAGLKTLAVSLH